MHFVCISSTGFWESKLVFDFLFAPLFACCSCCCSVARLSPSLWEPMDCSTPGWLCPQIIAVVYCLNAFLFERRDYVFLKNYSQCLAYSSCSINIQTKSFICSNWDYEKAVLQTILVEIKIIIPYLESFLWEHVNPLGLGGKKKKTGRVQRIGFPWKTADTFFSWSIIRIK